MGDNSHPKDKSEQLNDKLDEFASKASGPDVSYGSTPGYVEEISDDDVQEAAAALGATLYRNPDGSHEAVDESKAPSETDKSEK